MSLPRPRTLAEIDTPAVVIDLEKAVANLTRAQAFADAQGFALRPHIKTHKLPFFAQKQIALGAKGITCQKLGEAEVMADAGITDILLTYNILGAAKLARLKALHQRVALAVTADNATVIAGLADTLTDPAHPLPVLVECDTGGGRCGVQTPQEALHLAQQIAAAPGLRFEGLMTFPKVGKAAESQAWLSEAVALLADNGLSCRKISTGGTPDYRKAGEVPLATEFRPGTYIYLDRAQVAMGAGTLDQCAFTVLTTVVSRPTPTRAILDAGSKALSSDLFGQEGFGVLFDRPELRLTGLSEEHGVLDLSASPGAVAVGDRVRVLPNHACVVTNLFDFVYLVSGERVVDVLPVAARGKVG